MKHRGRKLRGVKWRIITELPKYSSLYRKLSRVWPHFIFRIIWKAL